MSSKKRTCHECGRDGWHHICETGVTECPFCKTVSNKHKDSE